jgi:ABC-type bacteriocin/lantibiotic exporter with double-glycine peptidase domain
MVNINQKLYWDFVSKNKGLFIVFIIAAIIAFPIQFSIIPQKLTKLISKLTKSNKVISKKDNIFSNVFSNVKSENITGLIIIIILLFLVILICSTVQETCRLNIIPAHLKYIRTEMFKGLIERHKEDYKDVPSAEYISRILEVSRVYTYLSEYIMSKFITYGIGIVVVCCFAYSIDTSLGIVTTISLLLIITNCLIWGKRIVDQSSFREGKYLDMVENLNNDFNNLMNIYINNGEDDVLHKNNNKNIKASKEFKKETMMSRDCNIITISLAIVSLVIIFTVGFNKVKSNNLSGLKFATFITIYIMYMHWSMELFQELPNFFTRLGILKQNKEFMENLFRNNNKQREHYVPKTGSLKIKNLRFKFPKSKQDVFKNVNMEIKHGEKVGIIGQSGSGKSTLVKLILQMYSPNEGQILIDNRDSNTIDIKDVRDSINYVNQRNTLNNDTIIKNISFGNNRSEKEIENFLKKHDLLSIFKYIENGIHGNAGVNGGNLSAGMQKTVLLTRALIKPKSKIYVFDEPLAGLDKNTREKIMKMITTECKDSTIICITHNKEIKQYVDRTIELQKSK